MANKRRKKQKATEYALIKFLEGISISRLFGLKEEQFPIPEE